MISVDTEPALTGRFFTTSATWEAQKSEHWPQCDLNTQPFDLESDVLPLYHEVGLK